LCTNFAFASPDGILNRVRCHRRIAILACRLWREALACAFRSRVCRQGYQSSMGRIFGIRRLAGRQAVSIELAETPLELQFDDGFKERGRVGSSPMTSTATPVSAAAKQQHYHNDNQDQFHGVSPLIATVSCRVPHNSTAASKYRSR